MTDSLIILFTTLGALFILISSYGIFKMPDFYTRLSVTVKAATLGIGCLLLASAIYFNAFGVTTKVIAIIFFLFITSPVSGFILARAAYFSGVKLWENCLDDELKDSKANEQRAKSNPNKSSI